MLSPSRGRAWHWHVPQQNLSVDYGFAVGMCGVWAIVGYPSEFPTDI